MEIENTTVRNFKELEGMLGNAKALKRNNGECKGILNGPSFFSTIEIPSQVYFTHCPGRSVGFGLKFRGADGKPT